MHIVQAWCMDSDYPYCIASNLLDWQWYFLVEKQSIGLVREIFNKKFEYFSVENTDHCFSSDQGEIWAAPELGELILVLGAGSEEQVLPNAWAGPEKCSC